MKYFSMDFVWKLQQQNNVKVSIYLWGQDMYSIDLWTLHILFQMEFLVLLKADYFRIKDLWTETLKHSPKPCTFAPEPE